jgi:hypothetical protein
VADAGAPAVKVASVSGVNAPASREAELKTELLALPPDVKVNAGHGLLEIRAARKQRLYVDGVFVGNYATRRVPLKPGSYAVRLVDGARELQHKVQVEAGQRTLLSVAGQPAP